MIPRLVAIDLDGTLLPESKVLTPRSRDALRALHAAGTTVMIATGKAYHLTGEYADALGLEMPVIALDGAVIGHWPNGPRVFECGIPNSRLTEIRELVEEIPVLPFLVDGKDRLVLHEKLEEQRAFLSVFSRRIDLHPDPLAGIEGEAHFLAFLGTPADARRAVSALSPLTGDGLDIFGVEFTRHEVGYVVVRRNTNKGEALARMAAELGIPRERTAAVGDWKNDLAMIRYAGTGVAMPAAEPELIEAADLVLPFGPEDDGVARWVESLLKSRP